MKKILISILSTCSLLCLAEINTNEVITLRKGDNLLLLDYSGQFKYFKVIEHGNGMTISEFYDKIQRAVIDEQRTLLPILSNKVIKCINKTKEEMDNGKFSFKKYLNYFNLDNLKDDELLMFAVICNRIYKKTKDLKWINRYETPVLNLYERKFCNQKFRIESRMLEIDDKILDKMFVDKFYIAIEQKDKILFGPKE